MYYSFPSMESHDYLLFEECIKIIEEAFKSKNIYNNCCKVIDNVMDYRIFILGALLAGDNTTEIFESNRGLQTGTLMRNTIKTFKLKMAQSGIVDLNRLAMIRDLDFIWIIVRNMIEKAKAFATLPDLDTKLITFGLQKQLDPSSATTTKGSTKSKKKKQQQPSEQDEAASDVDIHMNEPVVHGSDVSDIESDIQMGSNVINDMKQAFEQFKIELQHSCNSYRLTKRKIAGKSQGIIYKQEQRRDPKDDAIVWSHIPEFIGCSNKLEATSSQEEKGAKVHCNRMGQLSYLCCQVLNDWIDHLSIIPPNLQNQVKFWNEMIRGTSTATTSIWNEIKNTDRAGTKMFKGHENDEQLQWINWKLWIKESFDNLVTNANLQSIQEEWFGFDYDSTIEDISNVVLLLVEDNDDIENVENQFQKHLEKIYQIHLPFVAKLVKSVCIYYFKCL